MCSHLQNSVLCTVTVYLLPARVMAVCFVVNLARSLNFPSIQVPGVTSKLGAKGTIPYGSVTHIQVWPACVVLGSLKMNIFEWEEILKVIFYSFEKVCFISIFLEVLDYRESTYGIVQLKSWDLQC